MSIFKGNIFELINSRYDQLRDSEKRVADYILAYPEKIPNMTITELAQDCGVSETTVNRFNKMIGNKKYSDLRINMTVGLMTDKYNNIACNITTSDTIDTVASKLALTLNHVVHATESAATKEKIKKTIDMICSANVINFIGIGGSKVAAETAANLFGRAGFPTVPSTDPFSQYIVTSKMTPRDLLVAICLSGRTRNVLQLIRIAKEQGAKIVVLTSSETTPAALEADIVLATFSIAEPFYGNMIDGKFSQLYMIDLLYICSVLQKNDEVQSYLKHTGNAIRIYNGRENFKDGKPAEEGRESAPEFPPEGNG